MPNWYANICRNVTIPVDLSGSKLHPGNSAVGAASSSSTKRGWSVPLACLMGIHGDGGVLPGSMLIYWRVTLIRWDINWIWPPKPRTPSIRVPLRPKGYAPGICKCGEPSVVPSGPAVIWSSRKEYQGVWRTVFQTAFEKKAKKTHKQTAIKHIQCFLSYII